MKIKDGFILREVAGNFIVVAVGSAVKQFNGVITLNETGSFLWKQLEKGCTEEQLKTALLGEYDVDKDTAKADVTAFVEKLKECDAIVIGTPVYYAGPAGSLCAILDRIFFSAGPYLRRKPAACVVNARRGGCSSAFDRLNKYFTLMQMPVVSSTYWNSTHGTSPDEVRRDLEGLQVMRNLAREMAHLLKVNAASAGKVELPEDEKKVSTNFIS